MPVGDSCFDVQVISLKLCVAALNLAMFIKYFLQGNFLLDHVFQTPRPTSSTT